MIQNWDQDAGETPTPIVIRLTGSFHFVQNQQSSLLLIVQRELTTPMFAYRLRRSRNGERHIRGNRMNVRACIGFGILLSFLCAHLVSAQTAGTGALTGTVTDSTGGRIPGVTITATNTANGQTRVT